MVLKYDFTIIQSISDSFAVEIVNSAGTPIDLTGKGFQLDCRQNYNSEETLFSLSSANNTLILDNTQNNKVHLVFTHELSSSLKFDKGIYDMIAYLPDKSEVNLLMSGTVSLQKTITKLI
jgi:hypothetical protein